jgi:hypothetical protein
MNPLALERTGWPRRRLVYAVVGVFLAQAGLVLVLSQRQPPWPRRPEFHTVVSLATGGPSLAEFEQATALHDPTLLALPSLNGFSGAAWLRFEPLVYQPSEFTEPARWLALDERSLGVAFSTFVRSNDLLSPPNADRPLPPLQRYEPNYPSAAAPSESRLRIEGELTSRPLLTKTELQSWPYSEVLSNTVVQVVVDADGRALSTALLRESGLPEADQHAVKLAQNARWQPLEAAARSANAFEQLTWGRLIFQWHTLPSLTTNHTLPIP